MVFISRLIRVLLLDIRAYEEIEHDKSAIWQAILVVILAGIAVGINSYASLSTGNFELSNLVMALKVTGVDLLIWVIMSFIIYIIGSKLFATSNTKTNLGEFLRVLGFASAPGIFRVLVIVPSVGPFVWVVVWVWRFVAMVIAVRQAMDFENTWRAIWVCVFGLITYFLVYVILIFALQLPKPLFN